METPVKLNTKRDLWENQPKETPKAAKAFNIYLSQGDERSLDKVSQVLGCSVPNVRRWYQRWSWKERAAAWEANLVKDEIDKLASERIEMMKRHLNLSKGFIAISTAMTAGLQEEIKTALVHRDKGDPDWFHYLPPLTLADIMKLGDTGMKNERLVHGEPTDAHEIQTTTTDRESLKESLKPYLHLFEIDEEEEDAKT